MKWWLIRIPVFLFILGIFYDLEFLILTCSLLVLHFKLGLSSILSDYVHNPIILVIYKLFLRILSLELIYCSLIFLL